MLNCPIFWVANSVIWLWRRFKEYIPRDFISFCRLYIKKWIDLNPNRQGHSPNSFILYVKGLMISILRLIIIITIIIRNWLIKVTKIISYNNLNKQLNKLVTIIKR